MPNIMKRAFLDAFDCFPDVTFIWKYEKEDNITDGHANVVTNKWLPQADLLGKITSHYRTVVAFQMNSKFDVSRYALTVCKCAKC